jgi:hypothetical protein
VADDPRVPQPPMPVRRRREGAPRARRGGLGFLLAGAIPAAAVVWFYFLEPESVRREVLDKIPPGVGGRLLVAAIALAVLILLAKVALPAFHGASNSLRAVLSRFEQRAGLFRVLLFPAEAVVWTLWFLAQVLFAIDAALVIGSGLLLILLAIRVVKPDVLPSVLPELTR